MSYGASSRFFYSSVLSDLERVSQMAYRFCFNFATFDKLSCSTSSIQDSKLATVVQFSSSRLSPTFHRRLKFPQKASIRDGEWQEYQDPSLRKTLDLISTLKTLEYDEYPSAEANIPPSPEFISAVPDFPLKQTAEYFNVLDRFQNTMDLTVVGSAYEWLQQIGLLPNFGKYKAQASDGERVVTPQVMKESSGLEATKLSPKKWGLSGNSAVMLTALLGFTSYLVNNDIDVRPIVALLVGLGFYDAIYVGGTGLGQILSLWPPHRRRVLVHEAGHVLVAYLLGCPVRGVVLDAIQAMAMGIKGQAGTQFWDEALENELQQNKLTLASVDRYSIVLFAGIAAEAIIYGEAQGGEGDENLFKSVISQLEPSWGPGKMSNQARWAVLRAFRMLQENQKAHEAVVQALNEGLPLGSLIKKIEEALA